MEQDVFELGLRSAGGKIFASCILAFVNKGLDKLIPDAANFLHPIEKKRFDEMQYPLRQHSYLLGRSSAKLALTHNNPLVKANEINISSGVIGFPYVSAPDTLRSSISISHGGDVGVSLAFPLGGVMSVDIEEVNLDRIETIQSELTNKEKLLLAGLTIPTPIACTLAWTAKEGMTKALRCGMLLDLKLVEITAIKKERNYYKISIENFGFLEVISFKIDNYCYSIVYPRFRDVQLVLDERLLAKFAAL